MIALSTPTPVAENGAVRPTIQAERVTTIDILRGVALLGILLMNIVLFALPPALFREQVFAHPGDTNYWVYLITNVLFEGKMRAVFSLLFGAGVLLFTSGKEAASEGSIVVADLYYRRMLWLIVFGLVDAFLLLWFGDILYGYGLVGLLLFAFRNAAPRRLLLGALLCFAFHLFLNWWDFAETGEKRQKYLAAVALEKQHKTLTEAQQGDKVAWEDMLKGRQFNQKKVDKEIKAMRGNYGSVWHQIRPRSVFYESELFYRFLIWDALGMMLLGMALFKWGVLTNRVSSRTYWGMVVLGYGIGIPLGWWSVVQQADLYQNAAQAVDTQWFPAPGGTYDIRRTLVALGHIGVIMLLYRSGLFSGLWRPLSAVGQMAFTNYVMQTLLCTGIFYGYGLGYYGALPYYQLYYVVPGIWALQLIISPIWLQNFRFGPLEWVWRSLTYWQRQPMRRTAGLH
ncbi:DUF418 domain-containing protein [Nibrella saemangeumensis]|uniref:DUF418 domain-containing protein n=1 Tax=Nibrella saemangeumensis TaxID=1084526 RepID=A0ABP8NG28_9BACT